MRNQSFINELKEYFSESQENIDMYIESLVDNILLFNRSLLNSTRTFPLQRSLTQRTLREFTEIVIYRGFSKSYHKYLEYLDDYKQGDEITIPLPLSTSVNKSTSYRFVSYEPPHIIWKIIVPGDKFKELPGFLFENKVVKKRMNNQKKIDESEILLPQIQD